MNKHEFICEGCGKVLDMRNISVLSHGWIEDGKIVCYEEIDIPHTSRKVGTSVEFINGKQEIHLN